MVEVVDRGHSQVHQMEENTGNPVEDFEEFHASIEPKSIVSQATVRVFHQHESEK